MKILNNLEKITTKAKKRLGRGIGSGKGGHTVGRGRKGHKAREGKAVAIWFEGGQQPMVRKMPMQRGKARMNVLKPWAVLTLADLDKSALDTINLESLKLKKIIDPRFKKVKVIKRGSINRKITIKGAEISLTKGAKAAILKAQGLVD